VLRAALAAQLAVIAIGRLAAYTSLDAGTAA
jgi:hypothetical protein